MIPVVVLAFAAGLYIGVLLSHLRTQRDEGTRSSESIQQQQTRIFSDSSGGHSILDNAKRAAWGPFYDQDSEL